MWEGYGLVDKGAAGGGGEGSVPLDRTWMGGVTVEKTSASWLFKACRELQFSNVLL